jgi:hypothetical protein
MQNVERVASTPLALDYSIKKKAFLDGRKWGRPFLLDTLVPAGLTLLYCAQRSSKASRRICWKEVVLVLLYTQQQVATTSVSPPFIFDERHGPLGRVSGDGGTPPSLAFGWWLTLGHQQTLCVHRRKRTSNAWGCVRLHG